MPVSGKILWGTAGALVLGAACVLYALSARKPPPESISGQVLDTGAPVAGARVRYKAAAEFVVTDAEGRFQLPLPASTSARVVAAKEGFYIAGVAADASRPLVIELQRLPADDADYRWVDPEVGKDNCASCHADIHAEWSGSAHGRSATNPRLLNMIDGTDRNGKKAGWNLSADNLNGVAVCNSCHAPTADTYAELRDLKGVERHGVHCDYCHKIEKAGVGRIGWTHGRFGHELRRPREGQLFFGPLDDVDRGDDAFSPLQRQSVYCASCHEGTVFGVHVYSTYSEWLASPARKEGKECQSCHMTPTGKMTTMAVGGVPRDPKTLANHAFFAGSQEEMLRKAVQVTPRLEKTPAGVKATVEVRADNVGHRVPTGFVDRHLLLVVEGLPEGAGPSIKSVQGPLLPALAGKDLEGVPGLIFAKVLRDADGKAPVPFWQAIPDLEDTRLTPGKPELAEHLFPAGTRRVRVRLLYRKFWDAVAREKGWSDSTVTVFEKVIQTD